MRPPSKTGFFEAARLWQAADVAVAIRERPELASVVDGVGRTALHVCARRRVSSAADTAASIRTAKVLVRGGADVNAIQPIQDGEEVFPATPLWCALAWGRNRPLGSFSVAQLATRAQQRFLGL